MMSTSDESFHVQSVTWHELGQHQDREWIFRGHRCSGWYLETSLERACKRFYDGSLVKAEHMESVVLREFRRRFHHYSLHVPGPKDYLRWFSLMQHHGAPTRLLDWTYSIYTAAYFALEHATGDCAVWAIGKKWIDEEGKKLFIADSREVTLFENRRDELVERDFEENVMNEKRKPIPFVVQVNPFHLDERLTIQKGVFLSPGQVTKSFEDNLRAFPGYNDPRNVKKLVISHSERGPALEDLHSMNINRATLFPGLDGFAQSLKVFHPLL